MSCSSRYHLTLVHSLVSTLILPDGSTSFLTTSRSRKDLCANHWQSRWQVSSERTSESVIPFSSGTFASHPLSLSLRKRKKPQSLELNSWFNSGAGPIGLVTLLAANAAGCTPIVITDLFESRLAFAQSLVPRVHTVQIERGQSASDITKMVKGKVGLSFKVALECTGVESSISIAIYVSLVLLPFLSLGYLDRCK